STATHRDRQSHLARVIDRSDDVGGVERLRDQLRTAVEHPVEGRPPRLVAAVGRLDHRAAVPGPQVRERRHPRTLQRRRGPDGAGPATRWIYFAALPSMPGRSPVTLPIAVSVPSSLTLSASPVPATPASTYRN